MRIVGGAHRGLILAEVGEGDAQAHLRPTSDRVRESVFNILLGGRLGRTVQGARVLDLFAGTGALGLEALSRGAAHAVFVDAGQKALSLIRENLRRAGRDREAEVLPLDAARLPPRSGLPATLVFLDPPYGKGLGQAALTAARAGGWIAEGAVIVWEEGSDQTLPDGFGLIEMRRYGRNFVHFLRADAPGGIS